MTTVLAIAVFGTGLGVALWAIWTTVAADLPRIVDLLRYGPVTAAMPVISTRSVMRDVRVRRVTPPVSRRAAA